MQLVVAVLVRLDKVALPPEIAWTVSFLALGVGLVGALLEWVGKWTDTVEELMRELHVDKMLGVASTFAMTAILVLATSAGQQAATQLDETLDEQGVPSGIVDQLDDAGLEWLDHVMPEQAPLEASADHSELPARERDPEAEGDLAEAVSLLEGSGHPGWVKVLVLLIAVATNYGLVTLRGAIWERIEPLLEGLSAEKVFRFLEAGGALAALAVLALAPILVLVLLAALTLGLTLLLLALRGLESAVDRKRRRPCPHCGHLRRVEASLCPECHQALEPERWLVRRASPPAPTPEATPA